MEGLESRFPGRSPRSMGDTLTWSTEGMNFWENSLPSGVVDMARRTIREIINEATNTRLIVEQTAAILDRIGMRIQLLGITLASQMTEEHNLSRVSVRPHFGKRPRRIIKGTVQFYIKNRAAEAWRAASNMAAKWKKYCRNNSDLQWSSETTERLNADVNEIIERLWYLYNLNVAISYRHFGN